MGNSEPTKSPKGRRSALAADEVAQRGQAKAPRGQFTIHNSAAPWLIKRLTLFSLLFLLLLIPADTRDIRYFLPAHLTLHPLAAMGILALASKFQAPRISAQPPLGTPHASHSSAQPPLGTPHAPRFTLYASRLTLHASVISLLLAIQVSLTLIYFPYFVDYLNPVVGGPWLAPRLIKIGSGEGLDQMGRYLEQKPNAKTLRVATSFWESFVPFFSGRYTKPHYDEEADYILIYLRQIQNNNPFPEYWTYFSAQPPEHKVSLVGLDYVWLYPGPQLRVVREANFGDGLALRGYRLDRPAAQPGQTVNLTLVWAGASPAQADKQVIVQLFDAAGQLWAEGSGPLLAPDGPSLVEGHYRLDLPGDTPRDDYQLWVSLDNLSHQAGPIAVRQFDQPSVQIPASINFGDLIVFGGADVTPLQGEGRRRVIEIKLLWQARQPVPQSYTTFVHAVDEAGNIWGQVDHIPSPGRNELPTNRWEPAEWIVDSFQLSLKPDAPVGKYTLLAGWYNAQTLERLPIIGEGETQTAVEITSITIP